MNYLPSSAESMIRYLKSIAVRNSIYKDLHVGYLDLFLERLLEQMSQWNYQFCWYI